MMKLTKKVALEVAINAIENSTLPNWSFTEGEETLSISKVDAIEKLQKMMEQLDAKASAPKKPTKVQEENEVIKAHILELLEDGVAKTISEMMDMSETLENMSNQRVAALVTQLKNAGLVVRTIEKRKAYFSLPAAE